MSNTSHKLPSEVNLKNLEYSSRINPLLNSNTVTIKQRKVVATKGRELVDSATGEITAVATIHTLEQKDDESFVKVFAAGVSAAFELNRTSSRVFQAVLSVYEQTPMSSGYADSVYLAWFDDGLSGIQLDMSEKTFQRGLKDLIVKGFLSPRSPNQFWVNPALFFKGDRVRFVKEYSRQRNSEVLYIEEI